MSDTRTFAVLLEHKSRVDHALTALAKRAARKGLPVLTWEWGKPTTEKERVPHPEYGWEAEHHALVARVPLTLPCDSPKYNGWVFVAALQHLDGENVVRSLPGETVPETYRTRGPECDHCRMSRRRNDTFVLRHEGGRHIQVGSTCIGDFLGSDEAGKIAGAASLLAEARGLAEGGCEGFGSGSRGDRTLAEYLPFVAWAIREKGWTSRTTVREKGEGLATADLAWDVLIDGKSRVKWKAAPTEEDEAMALASEAWAEAITDEEIAKETGDYLHNLRAIARTGLVMSKLAGLAASSVIAYQRAVGRERARAERAANMLDVHLGNVGDKVTFGLPPKVGKRGQLLKGAPVVLSPDPVKLDFVTGYDTDFGYTTVLKFRTADGATLVWKASSTEIGRGDVGKVYTLAGTIKKHDDYKGAKQTILSRCDVREVETAPEATSAHA
jgi:hypothetical protein